MIPIFVSCQPRPEVLLGALKEEVFAARLKDVVDGTAEPVYQDPERFFANTFPTNGLRTLLREALGRLTGLQPTNNPILRLETAFGGGKTHNLIGLYHVARGRVDPRLVSDIMPVKLMPRPDAIDIAAVVGTDLSPSDGLLHADGVRTFTLWGELAYQIGAQEGYALARQSDQDRAAPGTGLFAELIAERPTLIMIDEIARHMRVGLSVPTATGKSNLAEQTVAFLMALLEFAASRGNVVVVFTLAGIDDAFGAETEHLWQQLDEAHRVSGRQEMVITPTDETELSAIVTHRLFEHIDPAVAAETAAAYAEAYALWSAQGSGLPERAMRADYVIEQRRDYPFHTELLNTLNRKTSTIPNFQKTRGALRLLALVVRQIWQSRPEGAWLIHTHHMDLASADIANDLTSRLQRPAFQQVIEADIVSWKSGSLAHAQVLDEGWVESGKPPYANRAATAVFLHSLTQGIASGVDPADLRLAVLQPGDEPMLVDRALERLEDAAWFFEWDGHRYRFKTEPSLNKIVTDEMEMVGRLNAKAELDARLRQVWKSGVFKVVVGPSDPSDLDDDSGLPKLAVIHYDAATALAAVGSAPPEILRTLYERAGALKGFRRYQNNVVFLVADADQVDNMVDVAQRYLAIQRIVSDAARMREYNEEQRVKLKKLGEATELDVRVAITRAYRHLYFPDANASQKNSHLTHTVLPAQDQGEVGKDQSTVVLRELKAHNRVLTGDENPLSAPYVKSRAWDANAVELSTEGLRAAFAQRFALPMLLDINQLKRTIKNGVDARTWIYYDSEEGLGYDHESPAPAIRIADSAVLYTVDEAARRKVPIKGKVGPPPPPPQPSVCPVCGNPVDRCTCGIGPPKTRLVGNGVPGQALQQLLDAAHDSKVGTLRELRISMDGSGPDAAQALRALGLALPQLGKADFKVEAQIVAEYEGALYWQLNLTLDDGRYKRLKQVTDGLAQEASKVHVRATLAAAYREGLDLGGDPFRMIHDVLTTIGLGTIAVEAEPLDPGEPT